MTSHPLAVAAPSLGLPVTICVLTYGPHAPLAERLLSSLYQHTDAALFQLRAGLNEVEPATRLLFEEYAKKFGNVRLFVEPRNVFKSPLMRRMFYEPPLESAWTIWCDDDTHFTRGDWLQRLALRVEQRPAAAMWGMRYVVTLADEPVLNWIRQAKWYRDLPFRKGTDPDGRPGVEFNFATGGFWAIRTAVLRQLDWPDARLIQANDDFLLGEALRQNQLELGEFRHGVEINDAPRRNPAAPQVTHLLHHSPK